MQSIVVDDLRVYFRTYGDDGAPSLLLLPGWGADSRIFDDLGRRLAAKFHVCSIDLPGFGRTEPPPAPWGVADYAALVSELVAALQLHRPSVVGHSFGGRVAIVLAASYPQVVDKIVLVNSAGLRPFSRRLRAAVLSIPAKLLTWCVPLPTLREKYLRPYLHSLMGSQDYLRAGPLRATFVKVVQEDLSRYASSITAPTLIMWGAKDADTPIAFAHKLNQLIPRSQLRIAPDSGHFSFQDWTDDDVRFVTSFLLG